MEPETHGPFDTYTEVETKYGTFGIAPGQVLTVDSDEAMVRIDVPGESTDDGTADADATNDAGDGEAKDSDGGTDDGQPGPDPHADETDNADKSKSRRR